MLGTGIVECQFLFIMFYQIADYPFELVVNDQELYSALNLVLHTFRIKSPPIATVPYHEPTQITTPLGTLDCRHETSCYRLTIELGSDARQDDLEYMVRTFEPEIVNQAIRESSSYLWIHGACLFIDGALTLLVAETGTGKTTLSLGLLHHGYRLLTDDIILIDPVNQTVIPVPRCPKVRPPAPDYLKAIGFDLNTETSLWHNYVLLKDKHLYLDKTQAKIKRIFLMTRNSDQPSSHQQLNITDGVLGLLPSSNIVVRDPSLEEAHTYFAETAFISMNLSDYAEDLEKIAGG